MIRVGVILMSMALSGCGGRTDQVPLASHMGVMTELPGKKGYFEIRARGDDAGARKARTKKTAEHAIVVYFYGPDGSTELSPAPTEVTIKVGVGDSAKVVPLSSQAQGGFASAPGTYPSAFRGTLNATIGGEPIEANFMIC
jgi:hypothetical protein